MAFSSGLPPVTEADFQSQVTGLAQLLGWRVAHFRPARTAHGWRTPVAADGTGFPDLLMARGPRLVVAELKSSAGRLTTGQQAWITALQAVPGIEVHVWRPADWPAIETTLTKGAATS